jgi:hypothetical protein
VRTSAKAELEEEMKRLFTAMIAEVPAAQRARARQIALDFPLAPETVARLQELAATGIQGEAILRRTLGLYYHMTQLGPTGGNFTLTHVPGTSTHYLRFERRINIQRTLAQKTTGGLRTRLGGDIFHELTHHWEYESPALSKIAHDWRTSRGIAVGGTPHPVKIVTTTADVPEEIDAIMGGFISDYTGRVYAGSPATEVFTVGMQHMYRPKEMAKLMAADPEHFFLVFGAMK